MKQLTLKQAIMKLPEVDKRWKGGHNDEDDNISQMIIGGKQKLYLATNSSIDDFHAAAKTLGYEIRWMYWNADKKYVPIVQIDDQDTNYLHVHHKTPAKAIQAAFIWCVEQKVKESKC